MDAPGHSRRLRPARASLSSLSLSRTQSVHGPNHGVNAPPESFITDAQNASIANCTQSKRRDFLRTLVMLDLAVEQVCHDMSWCIMVCTGMSWCVMLFVRLAVEQVCVSARARARASRDQPRAPRDDKPRGVESPALIHPLASRSALRSKTAARARGGGGRRIVAPARFGGVAVVVLVAAGR